MAPILETAFSLVFIYLIFSLITSWIVEYLSMRFQRRGKMLRGFIVNALEDRFNKNWGLMVYDHPLIEVLHREVQLPKGMMRFLYSSRLSVKRRLPSYIPADQFAAAVIEVVLHDEQATLFSKDAGADADRYILVKDDASKKTYSDLIQKIGTLKESEFKRTLTSFTHKVTDQENGLTDMQVQIAAWYENGMDRLNGWYKRATRPWLFFIGLLVAACFNVNTIEVSGRLYADPQLRAAVSTAADTYLRQHSQLEQPTGLSNLDSLTDKIDSLRNILSPLRLPIGWSVPADRARTSFFNYYIIRPLATVFASPLHWWIGWLLTAFALSFGAPFWFDTLKKIANVRSAGVRPPTSAAPKK